MIPPDAERDLAAALQVLGTGPFPDVWKSTILRGAAVVHRFCPPGSPYCVEAKRIVSTLGAIGASGVLGPGWDSPRGDMAAVLTAALEDAKNGSLWRGLCDAKNEAYSDVLQQADELLASNFYAAAAVLAGGALEAHLKDLCQRYEVSWPGDGSINKYQSALSAAQKQEAISFFSTGDGKLVTGWGDLRNRAAHSPASITQVDAVMISSMLTGVRDFIVRVP